MKKVAQTSKDQASAGHALRHGLFNKITPILLSSGFIGDSRARRVVENTCLDMVSMIEELIERYGLDQAGDRHDW